MELVIKFKNAEHKEGFSNLIERAKVQDWDKERISLFYTLAIFEETRNNIESLYDFKEKCIKIDGLNKGFQTSGTVRATKLAFNLFNNFRGKDRTKEDFSPLEIFCMDARVQNCFWMAIQIRFS